MFEMTHYIEFKTEGKKFQLLLLNSVEVVSSAENLVDTATIILPESVMNNVLNIEDQITRGSEVVIKLGYDNKNETEFVGYVTDVTNKSGTLTIACEDALFLFRRKIQDKIFKPAPVKTILQYLIDQIGEGYTLVMDVDYGIVYEKFTIYQAEAYDVLKKLQEELKANIYFDTDKKQLFFYAPYKNESGVVNYDMSINIESSSLEYQKALNKKVEILVESTSTDGTVKQVTVGTIGGTQQKIKVGAMSEADMKKIAEAMLLQQNSDKYEGSIDTWLRPFVKPTYRAKFKDSDYPERDDSYYVVAVTTTFSDGGGKRNVKFGIRL
jgi:hypothetical protein